MNFYIYLLYSPRFDKFYIGHSEDLWIRIEEHNGGKLHKYTSDCRPWILSSGFKIEGTRGDACKVEKFIKKQKPRNLIIKLIDPGFVPGGSLAQPVGVPH